MSKIDDRTLAELRNQYPKGTKVVLIKMDDVQAPPAGTKGVVSSIDDIGSIHVRWENGSNLAAVYEEDVISKVSEE